MPFFGRTRTAASRGRRMTAVGSVLVAIAGTSMAAIHVQAAPRARFDTRVLASIPDPGFVSLSLIAADRTIYGGTFFAAAGNAGDATPSRVFSWSPTGQLLRTYTITGQDLSANHGVQVAAADTAGTLYVLDVTPARVIALDPVTGAQRTYATIPHVAPCSATLTSDCKDTSADQAPEPDYAAWGPDGSLYVTDDTQGAIFRVPPGGGAARVWFTDPRLDGVTFGPTGLVLAQDHHTLLLSTAASNPSSITPPGAGALYTLPIRPDGSPGTLRTLWTSQQADGPDGFAISEAGNIYMALIGPNVNQIVELSPTGQVLARVPDAVSNAALPVPYDNPSSVQFDGDRLIVTNDSYFAGNRSHQVLFDVNAGERGAPVFRAPPPTSTATSPYVPLTPAASPPGGIATRQAIRLRVQVRPRRVRSGRRVRLHIVAVVTRGGARLGASGVHVRFGGRVLHLDRAGRVTLAQRFMSPRLIRIQISRSGAPSSVTYVRVRMRRHR